MVNIWAHYFDLLAPEKYMVTCKKCRRKVPAVSDKSCKTCTAPEERPPRTKESGPYE